MNMYKQIIQKCSVLYCSGLGFFCVGNYLIQTRSETINFKLFFYQLYISIYLMLCFLLSHICLQYIVVTESFDTFDFQILSISMKVIPINKSTFPFIAEVCRFKICYGQVRY